jgi:S1-C subfamily serine protease
MSTRKTTLFYALLIAVASLAVGMVIASRLDLTPASSAQTIAVPPMNSAPVTGALDAQTTSGTSRRRAITDGGEYRTGPPARHQRSCRTSSAVAAAARPTICSAVCFGHGPAAPGQATTRRGRTRRRTEQQPAPSRADHGGRRASFHHQQDGLILTNNPVVEGASKIRCRSTREDLDQLYQAEIDRA